MKKIPVLITIEGGIVQAVDSPQALRVIVLDFDKNVEVYPEAYGMTSTPSFWKQARKNARESIKNDNRDPDSWATLDLDKKTFIITVKQTVKNLSDIDDQETNPAGLYDVEASTEDEALDKFHCTIPIGCLDEFEITAEEVDPYQTTVLWGQTAEYKQTYSFDTQAELNAFLKGCNESAGWLECEIIEPPETETI